jgi:uncharacterized metal-binding protein YceD (DUF177 family)
MTDFPFSHLYELGRLSQAGDEVTLTPSADERARIAQWADVVAIDAFKAKVDVRKLSPTRFALDVKLDADVVQSCVVTLDPVRAHIEHAFTRDLILSTALRHTPKTVDIDPAPVDEDGREEIDSLRYDLAVPVLEEFALSIEPYPRAPGVEFEAPTDATDSPEHPFAALKGLKKQS